MALENQPDSTCMVNVQLFTLAERKGVLTMTIISLCPGTLTAIRTRGINSPGGTGTLSHGTWDQSSGSGEFQSLICCEEFVHLRSNN